MTRAILIVSARWHRFRLAETDASDHASAACYRRPEHAGVEAVVVPELKFRDVQRQIFGADLVERADHAALEDAPETFNRVGVNRANNVFVICVPDDLVAVAVDLAKAVVANPLVRDQEAHLLGNRLSNELAEKVAAYALDDAGDDVALPLDSADHGLFARPDAATTGATASLGVVPVLGLPASKGFVNLDDAAQLNFGLDQGRADFVTHGMGRLIAAEAHHPLDLQGAHAFLARKHVVGDAVPVAERLLGVLEDRADQGGEAVGRRRTFSALPVKRLVGRSVINFGIAAARAANALWPAARDQVPKAGLIVAFWEAGLKLGRRHLRDWLGTICHGSTLLMEGCCHG